MINLSVTVDDDGKLSFVTASLIPGLGSVTSALNAVWYGLEGDWADAVPAGVSAIPFASDVKFLSSLAGDADRVAPRLRDDVNPGGSCLRGANSFAADTRVEMADGSTKRIDAVEVGDRVRATDPTTGKSAPVARRAPPTLSGCVRSCPSMLANWRLCGRGRIFSIHHLY